MKSDFDEAFEILDEIFEKTDVMYNAIKADHFDVFEYNLELRGKMLLKYEAYKSKVNAISLDAVKIETRINEIMELDLKIKEEVIRFQKKIEIEHLENQKKMNLLTNNKKRTNQYQLMTEANLRGNMFDKQK